MAQQGKNPSALQETQVRSPGQEDPSEAKGSHSSILAWKIPWTEEAGGLQSMGPQELDSTQQLSTQAHVHQHKSPKHNVEWKRQTSEGYRQYDSICINL